MYIDHELTHNMIAGLSFTKEGRDLVQNLEAMRYYHKDGKAFYLGDGARLIISYNESPEYMQDNKPNGVLFKLLQAYDAPVVVIDSVYRPTMELFIEIHTHRLFGE